MPYYDESQILTNARHESYLPLSTAMNKILFVILLVIIEAIHRLIHSGAIRGTSGNLELATPTPRRLLSTISQTHDPKWKNNKILWKASALT